MGRLVLVALLAHLAEAFGVGEDGTENAVKFLLVNRTQPVADDALMAKLYLAASSAAGVDSREFPPPAEAERAGGMVVLPGAPPGQPIGAPAFAVAAAFVVVGAFAIVGMVAVISMLRFVP